MTFQIARSGGAPTRCAGAPGCGSDPGGLAGPTQASARGPASRAGRAPGGSGMERPRGPGRCAGPAPLKGPAPSAPDQTGLWLLAGLVASGLLGCRAADPGERSAPADQPGSLAPAQAGPPGAAPAPDLVADLRLRLRDPLWFSAPPRSIGYRPSGRALFFERPLAGQGGFEPRCLEGLGDGPGGSPSERAELPAEALDRARARGPEARRGGLELIEHGGDLFLRSLSASGDVRQLTRTSRGEGALRFLADGRRVAFEAEEQVYALDLDSGAIEELFSLSFARDPELEPEPELDDLASAEQRLIGTLAERRAREKAATERQRARERADPFRAPRPHYLPAELELHGSELSASGRYLAVAAGARGTPPRQDQMPAYVTDSSYVETRPVRPHVGFAARPGQRLFLLDREQSSVVEVDLSALPGRRDRPLAELEAARDARQAERKRAAEAPAAAAEAATPPAAGVEQHSATPPAAPAAPVGDAAPTPQSAAAAGDPRDLTIERLLFAPVGERLLVDLRSTDNKDRWLVLVAAGEPPAVLEHRRDPAWIGWDFAECGWLPDGRGLWWLSERSGHAQLWLRLLDEQEPRALTPAGSEVREPRLSPDGRWIYLLSNAGHPGIQRLARVGLPSGPFELLSAPQGRAEEFDLSPDGTRLCFLRSSALEPPEIFEMPASPGAPETRLTRSTSAEFEALDLIAPEFVVVPGPGGPIHGRLYLPPADAPRPFPPGARPAVLFVHGAGYLQNAHQGWSGYFREFFFHDLLARQGLAVLDLDYRASAGYGRDWRTAIHRRMGQPELEDLAAGVDFLVREHGVDPARVGVYGGSYGGFLTLMALFTRPGLFACGAALRPVTDWRHYNDGYTRNILETPELDPEGFARASPIEHAAGLERPLLICHGLLDDNVLAKDSIRLSQRLIELGKLDWELALYPLEAHGFREPSAWIDEYTRIWRLFQRSLLAPAPAP